MTSVDGALDEREDEAREEAEDDHEHAERHQRQRLDGPKVDEVAQVVLEELRQLAEEHSLEHPEQVAGGKDHHERRRGRDPRVVGEGADEGQELADESRQPGHPADAKAKNPNAAA